MVGEILPSESVDEILQCDHPNKELSGSAVCFSVSFKMKFGFWQFHGVRELSVKVKGSMKAKWDLLSCGLRS